MTQPTYIPIIPNNRLLELVRGYISARSDDTTRPDMNNEKHLMGLAQLVVDEARARLPLWELEINQSNAQLEETKPTYEELAAENAELKVKLSASYGR